MQDSFEGCHLLIQLGFARRFAIPHPPACEADRSGQHDMLGQTNTWPPTYQRWQAQHILTRHSERFLYPNTGKFEWFQLAHIIRKLPKQEPDLTKDTKIPENWPEQMRPIPSPIHVGTLSG